jgi:hypothetical protein
MSTLPSEDILPENERIISIDDPTNKAIVAMRAKLEAIAATATQADLAQVAAAIAPAAGDRRMTISAAACAIIVLKHNRMNRAISPTKVAAFVEDMEAGDFKKHHQGIAFTPESKLGDGQHRLIAGALTGLGLVYMLVSSDFDMDAIDAIDRSSRRTLAQALAMKGIADSEAKAPVARALMIYLETLNDGEAKPRLSDQRLERELLAREALITRAISMGRDSTKNVTEPALRWRDAAIWAAIALSKGWDEDHCIGFLAAVQQGVGAYHDSPTIILSKRVHRARNSEKRKDRLGSKELIALSVKASVLWAKKAATAQLVWNESKEGLPDPTFPVTEAAQAAAAPPPTAVDQLEMAE